MPKISAATVAEHHEAQRRALVDAAYALLSKAPDRAPGLADVAAEAGLARSSVYHYFRSRTDLLAAVLEDRFPRWNERVTAAMDRVPPEEKVLAYVDANLQLVVDGEHAVVGTLARLEPGAMSEDRLAALHDGLTTPLVGALVECGSPRPELVADLVNSLVHQSTALIESGADADAVRAAVRDVLGPRLGRPALGSRHPSTDQRGER
ncbi:TetR/AcrR family transcriptional regulator [Rhodococcus sp. HNM0569]|uniref:TetR/AcrR family transcriptional regulator n=1 Tax=Rhodococcus sp. HNM0569 TaxID=2716340 RepID=UPI00146A4141|nr:TetR/AcrR family transcriptional regulator [Rhodococcus sp. HNM0569]NLU84287.1 TetR/AcrR family transcriptional regulator [Rhodococcus sp. HNM0569]